MRLKSLKSAVLGLTACQNIGIDTSSTPLLPKMFVIALAQTKAISCNSEKKFSHGSCAHKSYRSFDAILRFFLIMLYKPQLTNPKSKSKSRLTTWFSLKSDFPIGRPPSQPAVEIRNFTQLRQKILWYNSRIPALAINELLSTSRRWSPHFSYFQFLYI